MNVEEIADRANQMREDVVRMLIEAGSGHSAGSLGMAEVVATLFLGGVMEYRVEEPEWEGRDRLILSNGHICPILYAGMAQVGYLAREELMSLRKLGSRLQGHPHRTTLPGLETTSGPLGSGLAQGVGMALGLTMDGKNNQVIVLCGDGEQDEGNHWEAVMLAAKYKVAHLTAITDRNNIQIEGATETVMPLEPLVEKYKAFGWDVVDIDGHNIEEIANALGRARAVSTKPTMIIANTIPGKGISYMENKFEWHGKPPTEVGEVVQAIAELKNLRTLGGKIVSEHE